MYRSMGDANSDAVAAKIQATSEAEFRKQEKKGDGVDVGAIADSTARAVVVYEGAQAGVAACAATGVGAAAAPLCGAAGAYIANELYGPVRDFVVGLFHDQDAIKQNRKYRAAGLQALERENQAVAITGDVDQAYWAAVRAFALLRRQLGLPAFRDYAELAQLLAMMGLELEPWTNCPAPPAPRENQTEWTDPVTGKRVSGAPQLNSPDFFCEARRNEDALRASAERTTRGYGQESRDRYYVGVEKQIAQGYQDAVDDALDWQEHMQLAFTNAGIVLEAQAAKLEIDRQMKKAVVNAARARGAFERYALTGLGAAPPVLHQADTALRPYMQGMSMEEEESFGQCLTVRGALAPDLPIKDLREGCRADVTGRPSGATLGKWALLGAAGAGVAWLVLR